MADSLREFIEGMLRGLQHLLSMDRDDVLALIPDRPNPNSQAIGGLSDFLAAQGGVDAAGMKDSGRRGTTSLDYYRTALGKPEHAIQGPQSYVLDLMELYFRARTESSISLEELVVAFIDRGYRHDKALLRNLRSNLRYARDHLLQEGVMAPGFEARVPELRDLCPPPAAQPPAAQPDEAGPSSGRGGPRASEPGRPAIGPMPRTLFFWNTAKGTSVHPVETRRRSRSPSASERPAQVPRQSESQQAPVGRTVFVMERPPGQLHPVFVQQRQPTPVPEPQQQRQPIPVLEPQREQTTPVPEQTTPAEAQRSMTPPGHTPAERQQCPVPTTTAALMEAFFQDDWETADADSDFPLEMDHVPFRSTEEMVQQAVDNPDVFEIQPQRPVTRRLELEGVTEATQSQRLGSTRQVTPMQQREQPTPEAFTQQSTGQQVPSAGQPPSQFQSQLFTALMSQSANNPDLFKTALAFLAEQADQPPKQP